MNKITRLLAATAAILAALTIAAPAHADQLIPDPVDCEPGHGDNSISEAEWYALELGVHKREIVDIVGSWGDRFEEASSRLYLVREWTMCADDGRTLSMGLMFTRTPEDRRWVLHEKG